ncbi:hypothetical protein F1640_10740 [Novosphingobium sp. NBM11]|nr:hypothetical protein [Novosphingobium sp. NBM11]
MGLFTPDFFRALLVGFLIGTAGMALSIGSDVRAESAKAGAAVGVAVGGAQAAAPASGAR